MFYSTALKVSQLSLGLKGFTGFIEVTDYSKWFIGFSDDSSRVLRFLLGL
jgi:hypothetical protein